MTSAHHFLRGRMQNTMIFSYPFYYLTTLLCNMGFIAVYVVLLVKPKEECKLKTGRNITYQFQMLFVAAVVLFMADIIIGNLVMIYVKLRISIESRRDKISYGTFLCQYLVIALEQLMGVLFLVLSVGQYFVLN